MTIYELHERITAYLVSENIDTSKLDMNKIARTVQRGAKFQRKYLELKDSYSDVTLDLFIYSMLTNYLVEKDIKAERKLKIVRELLKHI
jgi:hypothetical protein